MHNGRAFTLIPRIDENPRLQAFAQTLPGRICIVLVFSLLYILASNWELLRNQCGRNIGAFESCVLENHISILVLVAAFLAAYSEKFRYQILAFAALLLMIRDGAGTAYEALVVFNDESQSYMHAAGIALFLIFSVLIIHLAKVSGWIFLAKRPVAVLSTLIILLLCGASSSLLRGLSQDILWAFIVVFGTYFWYLGYALVGQSGKNPAPLWMNFGTFHTFWGSTSVPYGKGINYLKKFEARNSKALAISQLKGIKLLIWVLLLTPLAHLFYKLSHNVLQIPPLHTAVESFIRGQTVPAPLCWASLASKLFEDVLAMTRFGGVWIACARISGFRLLRNTYRPFESRTIAEFWNRYYFYFKELLADFFFFPTFVRYLTEHPRLRMLFATFMAACVGNLLYHFFRDVHYVAELGFTRALVGYQVYAFYCLVLATAIGLSQVRKRAETDASNSLLSRVTSTLGVCLFYCLIQIFDYEGRDHLLVDHIRFLLHIFYLE